MSGKGFKENLIKWQANFVKIVTNFCEKRKCFGIAPLRVERPRVTVNLGPYEFSIMRKKTPLSISDTTVILLFNYRPEGGPAPNSGGSLEEAACSRRFGSRTASSSTNQMWAFDTNAEELVRGAARDFICYPFSVIWPKEGAL